MLRGKVLGEILSRKSEFSDSQLMSLAWSITAMKWMDSTTFSVFREEAVSRGRRKPFSNTHTIASVGPISVIAQSDEYMVLNKPAGMVVSLPNDRQPSTRRNSAKSIELQDIVAKHLGSVFSICADPQFGYGIMHRLDRETTGALLVAKTYSTFYDFRLQFACNKIHKQYTCIVHGWPDSRENWCPVRSPLTTRKFTAGDMTTCVDIENGLPAHSEFKVIQNLKNESGQKFSLVLVRTFTGRTHQIRVHMASIGHPLLNDSRYDKTHAITGRVMLHASELGFLRSEHVTHKVPIPDDFQAVLDSLSVVVYAYTNVVTVYTQLNTITH